MKNTFVYYLFIFTPLVALVSGTKWELLSDGFFVVLLLLYAFVYRTITDTLRLHARDIIKQKDYTAILFPFSRVKYFRALYLP